MFTSKKIKQDEQVFLNLLYDFVLSENITDRERKIGLLAKKDVENGKYLLAVVNKVSSSMQKEAMKNGLSIDASSFYKKLGPIITSIAPIGLNRGSMLVNNSYLDWLYYKLSSSFHF